MKEALNRRAAGKEAESGFFLRLSSRPAIEGFFGFAPVS
jgi:hypothetical protein